MANIDSLIKGHKTMLVKKYLKHAFFSNEGMKALPDKAYIFDINGVAHAITEYEVVSLSDNKEDLISLLGQLLGIQKEVATLKDEELKKIALDKLKDPNSTFSGYPYFLLSILFKLEWIKPIKVIE